MIGLSRIQRYILAENTRTLITVLSVIGVSILLVDTVEQISTVGTRADISLLDALTLSFMKLPSLIEQTLSFALLIASMLTYRQLSNRAELPVIRASGQSAWKFLLPTILLAVGVGFFTMMVISPLGSELSRKFEETRTSLIDDADGKEPSDYTDIWLRDGNDLSQTIIHARGIDDTGTVLLEVRFIQEDRINIASDETERKEYRFARRIDAKRAKLEQGFWQLEGVTEFIPGNPAARSSSLLFATEMQQTTLIDRFKSPSHIGFWDLPEQIENSESVGISTVKLRVRYLTLTAIPIMFAAMSLIGALACLRLVRLGRTAPFIAFGAASSIALYFVSQLGTSFGSIGAIPPVVAAWTPPGFAVIVCLALVAYNEDG